MFAKPSEPENWSDVSRMVLLPLSGVLIHPKGLLRSCELLDSEYIAIILKAIKHLSMNSTLLDVLQTSNAIEILVQILAKALDSQDTVRFYWTGIWRNFIISIRKRLTTCFKHASISVDSTSHDKRKPHRLELFRACCESSI